MENIFGSHYSPTTVSISATVFEVFKNWQVPCRNGMPHLPGRSVSKVNAAR
ncbi:hypothetical protein [Paenibacillus apiarius]|uniref:hypothetical protein n=1 Tax=Paenibacillus apiarius TaxID=46240 RepID=UPI003AB955DD